MRASDDDLVVVPCFAQLVVLVTMGLRALGQQRTRGRRQGLDVTLSSQICSILAS